MKKVLIFGTFDGLHRGHLSFFNQARAYGDYLIVVLARDKTVQKIKNRSPGKDELERLKDLQECELVNEAKLGYEDNPYRVIKEIEPDVICLGYDQKAFTEDLEKELKKIGLKTKIYRLRPYKPEKFHSSIINNTCLT
jgi:FAD synthetase